ncbi:HIT family protein [Metasolibacillus meyeri]|uniref:HIT family protein n=1 Tax=Metasolibacillus meyeri TaxID=1071052 RepID=A0AAW9NXD6_9BACL|nr:HIT family protein [Metasolibacillus meyeri]MEC1180121.1 HIT family protein [Metasolibacillus meyeri]
MSECLFCKIIDGSIPSAKVYEDEHVYAFMDIMPLTKGHTLLIPKTHCRDLFEMPEEVASQLYTAAPKVAKAIQAAFNPAGLNTVNNNGAAAGQTVFHYHLHFIPRYDETDGLRLVWTTSQPSREELTEAAEAIQSFL